MAKTNHRLYIKGSNGTTYIVPLYTSTDDLKNKRGYPMQVKEGNNNLTLYFPIGDVGDPEQTSARLKLKNGTTVSILNTGTPPYTESFLSVPSASAGSKNVTGTFTVPAGVTRLRVALCPACIRKDWHWDTDGEHDTMVDDYYKGTDTTFGSISAQKNGNNQFTFGCKKSFTFEQRASGTGTKTGFYSIPSFTTRYNDSRWSHKDEYNKYYTGYMNVEPNQKIKYSIGGVSGQKNTPTSCGFILIAYGTGIEK